MQISIIVPIFNAEKYLHKSLNSLKNQTYKDLEIILVNDGSTDNSGVICDEFSQKDDRFKVIHKENGGVSSARNAALKIVSGEYVGFVDPDDWVENSMFEDLLELATKHKADISMCGYIKEKPDKTIIELTKPKGTYEYTKIDAINNILNTKSFRGFLWNKLFSTNLLKENKITFDEKVHFCEDMLFCCQAFSRSEKIVYNTSPLYHYIIHETNASKSQFSPKKLTALSALIKIIDMLYEVKGVNLNKFKNYFMNMNISLLMHGIKDGNLGDEVLKNLKNNLYRYKINELTNRSVKLSCILSRTNVTLSYLVWKIVK